MTRRATISFSLPSEDSEVVAAMRKLSNEADDCDVHRGEETKAFTFTDELQLQRTTNSRREAMIDGDNFNMIKINLVYYYRSFSIFLSFMV